MAPNRTINHQPPAFGFVLCPLTCGPYGSPPNTRTRCFDSAAGPARESPFVGWGWQVRTCGNARAPRQQQRGKQPQQQHVVGRAPPFFPQVAPGQKGAGPRTCTYVRGTRLGVTLAVDLSVAVSAPLRWCVDPPRPSATSSCRIHNDCFVCGSRLCVERGGGGLCSSGPCMWLSRMGLLVMLDCALRDAHCAQPPHHSSRNRPMRRTG